MLIPRRVKHRKQHRPDRHGAAKGGTRVTFGEYGIQAVEHSYVTNRQIEAARIAMTRHIRRGGKVWIYRGEAPQTRAEREAAAAALRAGQRPGRPPQGQRRPPGGRRADRAGGPGQDRADDAGQEGPDPVAQAAGPAAASEED